MHFISCLSSFAPIDLIRVLRNLSPGLNFFALMMKFKRGTAVEVMEQVELPFGSWRPARIVEGNGHTYAVRYDDCCQDMSSVTTKVQRKLLRPCPPPFEQRICAFGDIVEVFENNSWKLAEILEIPGRSIIGVRLLGSLKKILVSFSQLRMPSSWKDNCWIAFHMTSLCLQEYGKDKGASRNSQSKGDFSCQFHRCPVKYDGDAAASGRRHKRARVCITPVDVGACKRKTITIMEKANCYSLFAQQLTSQLLQKVDAVDSPQKPHGGKYMHVTLKSKTAGFYQNDINLQKPSVDPYHGLASTFDISYDESTTSSVDSCSVNNGSKRYLCLKDCQREEFHGHSDDAVSSSGTPKEPHLTKKDKILQENHNLELDEYYSTMMLLFKSGPLSWEQESILTNLRCALHISNDEHSLMLKHLLSIRRCK